MKPLIPAQKSASHLQFGLPSLFEFMTLSSILAALSAVNGVAASVFLVLMALALWIRLGSLAVAMLMAACVSADWSSDPLQGMALVRPLLVVLSAAALCAWYRVRYKCEPQIAAG